MRYSVFLLFVLSWIIQNCQSNNEVYPANEFIDTTSFTPDKYAHLEPIRSEPSNEITGWVNHYFSRSDCRCIYDGEYFISVKDAYPDSRNLMITLQGGGASWPGLEDCKEEVHEDDIYTTVFATKLADNLDQKWNEVLIPYCDGSIYMGDLAADYDEDGYVDHWHWGLRASSAGVAMAVKTFPDLENIFITGCSAGGYGTIIVARLIQHYYPQANIYVLNESGPGLFHPEDRNTWERIKKAWKLDQLIPADCDICDGQLIYLYEDLMEKNRNLKIGLYCSYEDFVIAQEYLKMTPESFRSLLLSASGYLNEKYPDQFKRFFINGDSHCVESHDYQINGTRYRDWVQYLINDSELWKDLLE